MLNCCKSLISNRIHRGGVNLRSILLCTRYPRQGERLCLGFFCYIGTTDYTDYTDIRIIRNEVAKFYP